MDQPLSLSRLYLAAHQTVTVTIVPTSRRFRRRPKAPAVLPFTQHDTLWLKLDCDVIQGVYHLGPLIMKVKVGEVSQIGDGVILQLELLLPEDGRIVTEGGQLQAVYDIATGQMTLTLVPSNIPVHSHPQ